MSEENSTKRCADCQELKPLSEFYADKNVYKRSCKPCYRATSQKRQQANYERYEEVRKEYRYSHPEVYKRIYQTSNARCRQRFRKAVVSGKLIPQKCFYCGNPKTEGHHDDYSKPFDVRWVCFRCHREKEHGQKVRGT